MKKMILMTNIYKMINKMMIRISFLFFIFYSIPIKAQNQYTLEECVNLAIEKNISIKQSIIDLENASIDKSNAIGNFLPQISAQSQHIWNYGLSQNITTGLIENLTTQFTSVGLNLGIDVYNGKTKPIKNILESQTTHLFLEMQKDWKMPQVDTQNF